VAADRLPELDEHLEARDSHGAGGHT
jgi:hypothetical protein